MAISEARREGEAAQARRSPLRRSRLLVMATIALTAIVGLALPVAAGSAQFVWNVTPSAPAGLYIIEHGSWRIGDRVAVLPSKALAKELDDRGVLSGGKLLIKRVVAAAGDTVCRKGGTVMLNGRPVATARSADSRGRALPIWTGCVTLTTSDVFLLGDTAGSYDGRYFGKITAQDVLGRANEILPFELPF